jgi:site-specific recombinase XerD
VRSFLAKQLEAHWSHAKASLLASALRSYFRYRATCGDQVGGLTAVISNPVHWKLASLPRALNPDDADRLLKSFATAGRWPKPMPSPGAHWTWGSAPVRLPVS